MKAEVLMFYILLLYLVICSIFLGVGLLSLNQYMGCVLIGCCVFLMYFVIRSILTQISKLAELVNNFIVFGEASNTRNRRINACTKLFSMYPLLGRRIIANYNEANKTIFAKELIDDYRKPVVEQFVKDTFPYDLIKRLSGVVLDDKKNEEIEKRLMMVLELNNKYPRALSNIFSYSSFPIHKLVRTYSTTQLLTISDVELMNTKLDEQRLQNIEKQIDYVSYLDSHLYDLFPVKPDAELITRYLNNNFQEYLYHFTHKENLEQIKEMGGLYSWVQLEKMWKPCQHPGGDFLSRKLDIKYNVADYVHLSFSYKHPMSYRNDHDIVILRIHPIVCLLPDTLFCNMNATDKKHSIGSTYKDLVNINLWTTKMGYLASGTRLFKEKQAEVLVKGYIPLDYIVNINMVS